MTVLKMGHRIQWLDNARAFAILAVILCHATENIYTLDAAHLNSINSISRLFAIISFTVGRLGVPLFLFLTGYLLLDRCFDFVDCKKFWRKKWLSLVITTEIWIVLYDVFLKLIHFPNWEFGWFWKDMLFLTQVHMGHMWYMPMIIGIYLFLPFIARGLQGIDYNILRFPIGVFGIYAFGIPVIQVINASLGLMQFGTVLDFGYSGGVYGIYILLGYFLKKGLLSRLSKQWLVCLLLLSFALTVLLQLFAFTHGQNYAVWYNCGLLLASALFLFEYFSRICVWGRESWWTWLSRYSFGIYLVHFPLIMLGAKWLKVMPFKMPVKVGALWIAVLLVSSIMCAIISKIPKMSKLLLYDR